MKIYKSTSKNTGITYRSYYPMNADSYEETGNIICLIIGVIFFAVLLIN